jgi:hypothetical protein
MNPDRSGQVIEEGILFLFFRINRIFDRIYLTANAGEHNNLWGWID